MRKTQDDLRKEIEEENEWDSNPLKLAIQNLFKTSMSNTTYRTATVDELISYTRNAFEEYGVYTKPKFARTAARLEREISKAASPDQVVLVLGEYLIAD